MAIAEKLNEFCFFLNEFFTMKDDGEIPILEPLLPEDKSVELSKVLLHEIIEELIN